MPLITKILAPFKNTHILSLIGTGFNAFIGMVVFGLLYRALSTNDIGIYLVFMVILNLIDTLKSGLLTNAFVNFFSGVGEVRANQVAGSTWSLAVLITASLLVINVFTFFIAGYFQNAAVILVCKCFAIVSLSTLPSFMANLFAQGMRRFDRLIWINMMGQFFFMLCIIGLMIAHKSSLYTIIISLVGSNIIASLITLTLGWTKVEMIKHTSRPVLMEIFHFGKYGFGSSISSNLFRLTDTFFLSTYLGPAAIAVYSLGGKLNQIVEIPLLSLATSVNPILAKHYNNGMEGSVIYTMKKMIGMLTLPLIILAILSVVFAEPAIAILGGNKYVHSEVPNIFRIFMCIAILSPADRFFALTLDTIHKPQINFYKIWVMLALNLIADYISVVYFKSVYGVALTYIFPTLAAIIIAYVPLNKYHKFNFWSIYVVGFNELITFVKQTYSTFLSKQKAVSN